MLKKYLGMALLACSMFVLSSTSWSYSGQTKGIYLTQSTLENTNLLKYMITNAKAAGINTFVIDLDRPSRRYAENIKLVNEANIEYVVRITMFPDGGTPQQINDPAYWQRKFPLIQQAINMGADQVQLDYIRFKASNRASKQNAVKIQEIIAWYKNKLQSQNIPLQVDVFGEACFGESKNIGQNIALFSESADAINPMIYPSHWTPYDKHFDNPYDIVYKSLSNIKHLFPNKSVPVKVYAYIELSNYHYRMSHDQTMAYITKQLKAVQASGVNGWYAWSPRNKYDKLFHLLQNHGG